jgi:hypothetical protein
VRTPADIDNLVVWAFSVNLTLIEVTGAIRRTFPERRIWTTTPNLSLIACLPA